MDRTSGTAHLHTQGALQAGGTEGGGRPRLVVQAESLAAVLAAVGEEADLDIVYAGERGVTERRITPFEIEGAALHAWCHLRDDERSFWLASIRHAAPARE